MITVVHLITTLETGGAETMLARLVAGMDRTRFRNVVVSMQDRGALGPVIEASGIPVETLGLTRHGFPDPRALLRLDAIIRREKPAVVQTWLYHADLLGGIATRHRRDVRLAWNLRCSSVQTSSIRSSAHWLVRCLAWLSSIPDAVVVNSQAGRCNHEKLGYRPGRWELIPNGIDADRFRPDLVSRARVRAEWRFAQDTPVIGLVGRLHPVKDHPTFLRAAAGFAATNPKARFVCIGTEPHPRYSEELRRAAAGLGLGDRLLWTGGRTDMPAVYATLDILALTSAWGEGFPNVLGEAMACGVPCVSTAVGDAAAIVGETGRIVPPGDPVALTAAFRDILNLGAAERSALGAAARQRIRDRYALPAMITRYEDLYADLAKGTAPLR